MSRNQILLHFAYTTCAGYSVPVFSPRRFSPFSLYKILPVINLHFNVSTSPFTAIFTTLKVPILE